MRQRTRRGFTLIELLVAIAIIGLLVALLLPAVQHAREAGRRMQCINNLKQIGLALANYESQQRIFPPAAIRPPGYEDDGINAPRSTWTLAILPFLEQQPLFNAYDPDQDTRTEANSTVRTRAVEAYLCPSDTGGGLMFELDPGVSYARGNYGANLGSGSWGTDFWAQTRYRGVMGQNVALRIGEIVDGTSTTVAVGELRIGPAAHDNRGVWAFPAPGSASLCLDANHILRGINDPNPDFVFFCEPVGGGPPCQFQLVPSSESDASPRSRHPGGANFLFCDGSARFLSQTLDKKVLAALFTSQNGEVVEGF